MLLRIACARCHLASLWTDDPECFLATVCNRIGRCEATLVDENFRGVKPREFDAEGRGVPRAAVSSVRA
jgi:hypothetical protein